MDEYKMDEYKMDEYKMDEYKEYEYLLESIKQTIEYFSDEKDDNKEQTSFDWN